MTTQGNGQERRLAEWAGPRGLRRWFDEMESMMRAPFARLPFPSPGKFEPWAPAVDIVEKDNEIVVKADLPGVTHEDITVTVDQDALVIRAERKQEEDVKEKGYRRLERYYGQFERTLALPEGANADAIKASYHDGVLEIKVPVERKEAKPAAKKIPVS